MNLEEITLRLSNGVAKLETTVEKVENQVSKLETTVEKVDEKVNELTVKVAGREGETRGIRRSAVIVSTIISLIIGCISVGVAIAYSVR